MALLLFLCPLCGKKECLLFTISFWERQRIFSHAHREFSEKNQCQGWRDREVHWSCQAQVISGCEHQTSQPRATPSALPGNPSRKGDVCMRTYVSYLGCTIPASLISLAQAEVEEPISVSVAEVK